MTSPCGANLQQILKANLEKVLNRAADLGADPSRVRVVAVTKSRSAAEAAAAVAAGICDLGENYAGELADKSAELSGRPPQAALSAPPQAAAPRWHFIGNIQRNKVRKIAGCVSFWQSLDRQSAAAEIARRQPGARVLLQISPRRVPGRGGCPASEASLLLEQSRSMGLSVEGLMSMALPGPPEEVRAEFRALRSLADSLELPIRSMGTSSDWELAILEGASMLRLGKVLFASSNA